MPESRQWVGCLTPAEILALVADGHRPAHAEDLDYVKSKVTKGESGTHWFYFFPTGKTAPKFAKGTVHDKSKGPEL